MTKEQIIFAAVVLIWLAYALGKGIGRHQQRKIWQDHMDLGNRYRWAVDDLDRWCGHMSPHARLIANHLRAHGEGHGVNAGTPNGMEPCTVDGLRSQLKSLKEQTP